MAAKRYRSSDEASNVRGRISETLPVTKKANLQRYFTNTMSTCTRRNEADMQLSVETGSGHPGHPGHIFSWSYGSDPVYNLSGSDPDWIT